MKLTKHWELDFPGDDKKLIQLLCQEKWANKLE